MVRKEAAARERPLAAVGAVLTGMLVFYVPGVVIK